MRTTKFPGTALCTSARVQTALAGGLAHPLLAQIQRSTMSTFGSTDVPLGRHNGQPLCLYYFLSCSRLYASIIDPPYVHSDVYSHCRQASHLLHTSVHSLRHSWLDLKPLTILCLVGPSPALLHFAPTSREEPPRPRHSPANSRCRRFFCAILAARVWLLFPDGSSSDQRLGGAALFWLFSGHRPSCLLFFPLGYSLCAFLCLVSPLSAATSCPSSCESGHRGRFAFLSDMRELASLKTFLPTQVVDIACSLKSSKEIGACMKEEHGWRLVPKGLPSPLHPDHALD